MSTDGSGTLYERLGGENAVMVAVTLFYEKVMADPELAVFFEGLDMGAQINKQIAFMTMVFGGPHQYTGRELTVAHAPLVRRGLGPAHFDRTAQCLKSALEDLKVSPSLVDEVLQLVASTRSAVLGAGA